jgi:hypothetical protein
VVIAERREVVVYLRELSTLLNQTTETRRAWIHELSPLLRDAERRDPLTIARSAVSLGREHLNAFRDARAKLRTLSPPSECMTCHAAAISWLDEHVTACERLVRAGETRDVRRLRAAQEPLADARACAQRITLEYTRLVDDLRQHVPRRNNNQSFWSRFRRSPN